MTLAKDILVIYEDLNIRALSKASGFSIEEINNELIEISEEEHNETYSYIHHVGFMIALDQKKNYDFEESFYRYGGDPEVIDGCLPTLDEMIEHMATVVKDDRIDLGSFKKECVKYSKKFSQRTI